MAVATAIDYTPIIAPILGLAVLLAAQYYLGRVPDLWQFRRTVLPAVAALDHRLIPSKTTLRLQPRERVGVIDAPPSVVRAELRDRDRTWPCNLASLQWDHRVDGVRNWEVGSYAERPGGWLGRWQIHVRLTETDDGRTALWAHREYSPWRAPVKHYRSVSWDAKEGVKRVQSWFEGDDRFEPAQ